MAETHGGSGRSVPSTRPGRDTAEFLIFAHNSRQPWGSAVQDRRSLRLVLWLRLIEPQHDAAGYRHSVQRYVEALAVFVGEGRADAAP